MQPSKVEPFDHTTHVRDAKSGQVKTVNLYKLVIEKQGGVAVSSYERPPESGIWYHPNGALDEAKSAKGLAAREAKLKVEAEAARVASLSAEERERHDYEQALKRVREFEAKAKAAQAAEKASKA